MKSLLIFLFCSFHAFSAFADDAERYPVAKKIKKHVLKQLNKSGVQGFCDVYVHTKIDDKYLKVIRVNSSGDHQVCDQSKKVIPKGKRYKSSIPHAIIHIHVSRY